MPTNTTRPSPMEAIMLTTVAVALGIGGAIALGASTGGSLEDTLGRELRTLGPRTDRRALARVHATPGDETGPLALHDR